MRLRTNLAAIALMAGAALAGAAAAAPAIEHNEPVVPKGKVTLVAPPNLVASSEDKKPLGANLSGVVLLGKDEAVRTAPASGIDLAGSDRLRNDAHTQAMLKHLIGKPISRKLIAEIQADIARRYRTLGYPFVSLSTPEQEISTGVIQIRVIEFKAGDVKVTGAKNPADASEVAAAVHQKSGEPINAPQLTQDLTGLNRYPFHQVAAMFTPGQALGTSDLDLQVKDNRPWQVYAGWNNAGSPSSGKDRYFIGGTIGGLLGKRSLLSMQRTVVDPQPHSPYQSTAFIYSLPIGKQGLIEATLDAVESDQTANPFVIRLSDLDTSVGYRHYLRPSADGTVMDVRGGVEYKHEVGKTIFNTVSVFESNFDVYQVYLGAHRSSITGYAQSDLDLVLHVNPGNISGEGDDAAAISYSQGRMKGSAYAYAGLTYDRTTRLPFNLSLKTLALAQLASDPLPRSEQAGLGGFYLVRGYSLDDGAFDSALVLRNELQWAARSDENGSLRPYVFVDLGHGYDNYTKHGIDLASTGVGTIMYMTDNISLNANVAYTLKQGVVTSNHVSTAIVSLNFGF